MVDHKYKLFKTEAGSPPPPCAFFHTKEGCKNGANCAFSHDIAACDGGASTSSSSLSSESEGEIVMTSSKAISDDLDVFVSPRDNKSVKKTPPKASKDSTKGKKKRKRNNNSDVFATPKEVIKAETENKKIKQDISISPKFESNFRNLPIPIAKFSCFDEKQTNIPSKPLTNEKPKKQDITTSPKFEANFRNLPLPIAKFSCLDEKQTNIISKPLTNEKPKEAEFPTPKSTPEGIKWRNACLATRTNPKYLSVYDFEKFKESDEKYGRGTVNSWIKARPFGPWCAKNPHAIAVDCEMCETKDPSSGAINPRALCRISVINALNPDDVLLDTLVKPDWPVTDYRSRINGINKSHLDSVKFTLQHAQAFMTALCSEETVIIGHAIQNDLSALKMEHHCNVDSAFLFTVKDEPNATCSLRDLAMTFLKIEMPEPHDSVNDARVALQCIEEGYVRTQGVVQPIVRTYPPKSRGGNPELFVHRIPRFCNKEHISKMFLSYTSIELKECPDIQYGGDTGKVTVSFVSGDHANLAFKTIPSEAKPDKTGRLQKRIYLRNGGYVQVRKMTMERSKSDMQKRA